MWEVVHSREGGGFNQLQRKGLVLVYDCTGNSRGLAVIEASYSVASSGGQIYRPGLSRGSSGQDRSRPEHRGAVEPGNVHCSNEGNLARCNT